MKKRLCTLIIACMLILNLPATILAGTGRYPQYPDEKTSYHVLYCDTEEVMCNAPILITPHGPVGKPPPTPPGTGPTG